MHRAGRRACQQQLPVGRNRHDGHAAALRPRGGDGLGVDVEQMQPVIASSARDQITLHRERQLVNRRPRRVCQLVRDNPGRELELTRIQAVRCADSMASTQGT